MGAPITPHNPRSPEQFELIRAELPDFTGFRVMDFGCGYGDLARMIWAAGAAKVGGLDKDSEKLRTAIRRASRLQKAKKPPPGEIWYFRTDLLDFVRQPVPDELDKPLAELAICFSVLPYFARIHQEELLSYFRRNFITTLIECPYAGVLNGSRHIENDEDMEFWLRSHWEHVFPIGRTSEGSHAWTLWICT